jgi:hypothetical protein
MTTKNAGEARTAQFLSDFILGLNRIETLGLASEFLLRHREEIEIMMPPVRSWPKDVPKPQQYADLKEETSDTIAAAKLILLKASLEAYCGAFHRGNDHDCSDVVRKTPQFKLKYQPDSEQRLHVIQIVKELRDKTVHPRISHNTIQSKMSPAEILRQLTTIESHVNRRSIRFGPPSQFFDIAQKEHRSLNLKVLAYGDLLTEMSRLCIIQYEHLCGCLKEPKRKSSHWEIEFL